jgi:hypothetical protein
MNRSLATAVAVSAVTLGIAACEGDGRHGRDRDFDDDPCNSYSSCETCTPILGCGWCYKSDGTGACAASSIECEAAPAFSWTWDPTGCHAGADASVRPIDAGPMASDASPGAPASDASIEASPSDGATPDAGDDAPILDLDARAADGLLNATDGSDVTASGVSTD